MPIENKYEVDDELEEIDDEFDLLAKEYGEEYAIEVLTNYSKRIFDKVIDYVVPFRNSFNTPNDKHSKVDIFVVSEFKKYINRLLKFADGGNTPIKELEILYKTLKYLEQSNFLGLYKDISENEYKSNQQPTDLDNYQLVSNIYTNIFLDIFNSEVRIYLNENKIPLE